MDFHTMLKSAQTDYDRRTQNTSANNSVASFFTQCKVASNQNQSLPIQIQRSQHTGMTLESIEQNLSKKISQHDTQNNNLNPTNANSNNLANSPLAQFLNSSNLCTVKPNQESSSNRVVHVNGNKGSSQQGFKPPIANGHGNGGKETKLLTPAMLTTTNKPSSDKKPEPLNKNQLVQALKYLIDNDEEFSKKVYDAYLKSMNNSI